MKSRIVGPLALVATLLAAAGGFAQSEEPTTVDAEAAVSESIEAAAAEVEPAPLLEPEVASPVAGESEAPAEAGNDGLADLDKAAQLKVTAQGLADLNDVIDRLDSALEKGLDDENRRFAEELLVSTLLQRATTLSAAILSRPIQDPRWTQVRQFALTDLQRALELDATLWDAYLLIGRLQALPLGDPNAARRALSKVVDAEEADPQQRAQAAALRGALQTDDKKQAADFDRAIELQPEQPEYYRLRAKYRSSKEQFEEALADIDRALELEPDDAATLMERGLILTSLDRLDDALQMFDKAGELAPNALALYQHRSEVYRRQGDLEKAAEQLTKAIELSPGNPGVLLLRSTVYYQLNDIDRALQDVDAVLAEQAQLPATHLVMANLLRAELLANAKRFDEAIAQLEGLVARLPDQVQLLEPLGTYYLIAGRPRKCIETFSRVIELDPDNYRALRFRGDAYLNIGKHVEAVADFERALELSEEDEGLLNNYAWVLATSPQDEVRDGKRAVELATKAAEIGSYNVPHVLSTLAAAYAESGDFESAKKWSDKSIEAAQHELDLAESDEDRKRFEADVKNLQQERASYERGEPVREQQFQEEGSTALAPQVNSENFAPPSAVPAPARTLDF